MGSPDDEEYQQGDQGEGAQNWSGPNENVCLFERAENFTEPTFDKGNIFTSAARGINLIQKRSLYTDDTGVMRYYPDKKMDTDYALPGDYTVKFRWKQLKTSNPDIGDDERIKKDMTEKSSTMTIKVVDDMYVPTIDITKRTLTNLSESGVMEVLRPDCDMNCNISPHASVIKLLDKDLHDIDYSKKDVLVRYAVVHHSGCNIYVPLTAVFSEKI
ncbi:MAG: hypothetical protein IJS24_06595 [Eubacterium sp.]|nr:hypothetical protein [Eubacterium sp.]